MTREGFRRGAVLAAAGALLAGGGFAAGRRTADASHACPPDHHATPAEAGLPQGHPDIGSARVPAPPLDDAVLAKGKAADCPYVAPAKAGKQQVRKAGEPDARELAQYVLGGAKSETQGGPQ